MVFCLISPHILSPTRKWKTHPYGMCFLSSDGFVYTPPCLPHLHNPKNPVQMARFRVFYLIPHIPSPTQKWKTRPYGTCFLASDGFIYISPCLLHVQNTKKPSVSSVLLHYSICPPPPENGKHAHMGHVFWVQMGLFIFPHAYSTSTTQKTQSKWLGLECSTSYPSYFLPHPKIENMPRWDVFSGFGWVCLYSPMFTTHSKLKKPSPNGWVLGVLPHTPYIPSHLKIENQPYGMCFLGSGGFIYIFPCLPHVQNSKSPVQMTGF